jgi:hypothetical protein
MRVISAAVRTARVQQRLAEGKKLCRGPGCGVQVLGAFSSVPSAPDGLDSRCRRCRREAANRRNRRKRQYLNAGHASAETRRARMLERLETGRQRCPRCCGPDEDLPLDAFGKDATAPTGLHSYCLRCKAAEQRPRNAARNQRLKREREEAEADALAVAAAEEQRIAAARQQRLEKARRAEAERSALQEAAATAPGRISAWQRAAREETRRPDRALTGWVLACCGGRLADTGGWWAPQHGPGCEQRWRIRDPETAKQPRSYDQGTLSEQVRLLLTEDASRLNSEIADETGASPNTVVAIRYRMVNSRTIHRIVFRAGEAVHSAQCWCR